MKKILSLVLSLALAAALVPSAFAVEDFADQDQLPSWALDSINYVHQQGYMVGDQAGNFNPNNPVSRAEFIIMLTRVLWPDEVAARPDGDTWWSKHYDIAAEKYLLYHTDYATDPNGVDMTTVGIPRQEMALLLQNAYALKGETMPEKSGSFAIMDRHQLEEKYQIAAEAVFTFGLLQGDENGNFNGKNAMSRAEGAVVLSRLVDKSRRVTPPAGRNHLDLMIQSYTPIPQTWTEGEEHYSPAKKGDTVIRADGTRVVLNEVTLSNGRVVLGYGQGVDFITGYTLPNGYIYGAGSPAYYYSDSSVFERDKKSGEVRSAEEWNGIGVNSPDVKGSYDGEIRDVYFKWNAQLEEWIVNIDIDY